MSYETDRERIIATRTAMVNDPRVMDVFVYGTREDVIRLLADLYATYTVSQDDLAALTNYMLKIGAAPGREYRRGG